MEKGGPGSWRTSLRYQLPAAVAVGVLLLFALLGYFSLSTTRHASNMVFSERLRQAQTAANSIDTLLLRTRHQLENAARMEELSDRRTVGEQGSPWLSHILHLMGSYDALWLVGREGEVLAASSQKEEPFLARVAQQPFFSQSLRDEVTGVGHMELADPAHPPIAIVVAPVRDHTGGVYGGLVGSLHLAHMGMNLASLPRGGGSVLSTVVDRQGTVLATSEGIDTAFPYPDPHLELLRGFMQRGEPGVALHQEPRGGHVVVYAPLSALEGGVIVEERQDTALAMVSDLRNTFILVGAATLALSLGGAWLLVRHITQPLESLGGAARRIAAGQLDRPVATRRRDEIGRLARSFEAMRQQLQASHQERERWGQELEARVRERTEEVHRLLGRIISAQEEERQRLARELHDETAQALAALLLGLSSLQGALPPEATRQREMLGRFLAQGEQALRDIRRLIQDLRPSHLDDMGLVHALRAYAEERLVPAGTSVKLEARGAERRLPWGVETALFRIMQEAVTNVAKHARAGQARILLEFGPDRFLGVVEDDGVGFDPGARQGGEGVGLQGMQERADLVGARLEVISAPGRGTRVRVEMPLPQEAGLG